MVDNENYVTYAQHNNWGNPKIAITEFAEILRTQGMKNVKLKMWNDRDRTNDMCDIWLMSKLYTPAEAPTIKRFGWNILAPMPPDMTPMKYTKNTLKCPCSVSSGNATSSWMNMLMNRWTASCNQFSWLVSVSSTHTYLNDWVLLWYTVPSGVGCRKSSARSNKTFYQVKSGRITKNVWSLRFYLLPSCRRIDQFIEHFVTPKEEHNYL